MIRFTLPALVLASPALAHADSAPHVHGADYAIMAVGLAILAIIAIALLAKLPK